MRRPAHGRLREREAGALEQLGGVADSLLAAPAPVVPTPTTAKLAGAGPVQKTAPALLEALRFGVTTNALVRRELEQQLERRLAPIVRRALSRIATSGEGPHR